MSGSGFSTASAVGSTVAPCPGCLIIHLHVDADRDGKVDDDYLKNTIWDRKSGAVILCNNDNDDNDAAKEVDYLNDKIDTAADETDIAPLDVRIEKPKGKVPAGWKAFLKVKDKTKIRIFDKRVNGGKEIIGPTKGKKYQIPDLTPDVLEYGMEAIQYPGPDWKNKFHKAPKGPIFDGMVDIILTLEDDKGKEVHGEIARVRVAPWLMTNHNDPTEKVYVAKFSGNKEFLDDLNKAAPPNMVPFNTLDPWMQDVMELGFSAKPNDKPKDEWLLPSVLRTTSIRDHRASHRTTERYPKDHMLGPGFGFTETTPPAPYLSLSSFGNMECSPPFIHPATGKEYKFGRIIYGDILNPISGSGTTKLGISGNPPMHNSVVKFIKSQKVQNPFPLDTGWLMVGHVDEFLSFLPLTSPTQAVVKGTSAKRAVRQFKVLLASPDEATKILKTLKAAGRGGMTLFNMGTYPPITARGYTQDSIDDLLDKTTTAGSWYDRDQTAVQAYITSAKNSLIKNLGLAESDFIHLPAIFKRNPSGGYIAHTAGAVNMLVITRNRSGKVTLCIPKPFGPAYPPRLATSPGASGSTGGMPAPPTPASGPTAPKCEFEKDIEKKLAGFDIKWIYDFNPYHVNQGEVHCGTNSKRKPRTDRWWWEQEGI